MPTPAPPSSLGSIFITADNQYTLYVDSSKIGSGTNWQKTQAYNFKSDCTAPTQFAVELKDQGGPAAFIAEWNHCGETLHTDQGNSGSDNTAVNTWKCTYTKPTADPANGPLAWTAANWDESTGGWISAASMGKNGVKPWGKRPEISDEAKYIRIPAVNS